MINNTIHRIRWSARKYGPESVPGPDVSGNEFEFSDAMPTLADFEAAIGVTLVNPRYYESKILFDNTGYAIADLAFFSATTLKTVKSQAAYIGNRAFNNCDNCSVFDFPLLTDTYENQIFYNCIAAVLRLPSYMPSSNTDHYTFEGMVGLVIELTIPTALMTINGGLPDENIQYLLDNNTVTLILV